MLHKGLRTVILVIFYDIFLSPERQDLGINIAMSPASIRLSVDESLCAPYLLYPLRYFDNIW